MDNNTHVLNNVEKLKKWYQKRKKVIITGAVIITATAATATLIYFCNKNIPKIVNVAANNIPSKALLSAEKIEECIQSARHINVDAFLRKLPENWHASKAQLELAATLGITVPDGYTFVKPFIKYADLLNCT